MNRLTLTLAVCGMICLAGCDPPVDSGLMKTRDAVVLSQKPAAAKSIGEAVVQVAPEMAESDDDLDPSLPPGANLEATPETDVESEPAIGDPDVTILAQIGAGDFDPFESDRAAFMLSEIPPDHGDQVGHDASKCPFCKRRAEKAPRAHVILVGGDSQPISVNAAKLLDVKKGDQVIVRGSAVWDEAVNVLKVTASGVYVVKHE